MINLTHEEAQQVLDALKNSRATGRLDDQAWGLATQAIETLRARLREPEPEREQCDMPCIEDDGCPTEKAVLQRFWRKHRQLEPEPVAWDVWIAHNHIFFSIGVQTFQINDVLEHEPEVLAKEFSEWLATQLRHALTLLSTPPQREWVGLTDDEYELMAEKRVTNYFFNTLDYAHDIEAKLKEKNT